MGGKVERVRLTAAGKARLAQELRDDSADLERVEEAIRQMLLCKCDLEELSLRDARTEKLRLEERVAELEDTLTRAEIAMPSHDDGRADIGSYVTIEEEGSGQRHTVQLVSPVEAGVVDGEALRVSDRSPVGKELRGREVGDSFSVPTGDGHRLLYRVVELRSAADGVEGQDARAD
jgi:transcription elongation factor GreA